MSLEQDLRREAGHAALVSLVTSAARARDVFHKSNATSLTHDSLRLRRLQKESLALQSGSARAAQVWIFQATDRVADIAGAFA